MKNLIKMQHKSQLKKKKLSKFREKRLLMPEFNTGNLTTTNMQKHVIFKNYLLVILKGINLLKFMHNLFWIKFCDKIFWLELLCIDSKS